MIETGMKSFALQELQDYKYWFHEYVDSVKSSHPDCREALDVKEEHTLRVCCEIVDIGTELGLKNKELLFAEISALFHDVGRFEQYAKYHTFSDYRSENHSESGVRILKEKNILKNLNGNTREMMFRVILNHNSASVPPGEETCLFFSRLLRDADKLDIWRVMTSAFVNKEDDARKGLAFGLPDTNEISDPIYKSGLERNIADVTRLKTLADYKLLLVGLVYDVNFIPTFRKIKERKYMEMIQRSLPSTEKFHKLFSIVQDFLDHKINN